jgi:hypothetical protein
MISEIIKEKRFQSRAFLLMPMTFNIGVIIGPILGGILADPVGSYPSVFGPNSVLGGKDGVYWMKKWPYALPNLVSAIFLVCSVLAVFLGLKETHEALWQQPDHGLRFGRWLFRTLLCYKNRNGYSAVAHDEASSPNDATDIELQPTPTTPSALKPSKKRKLPLRRIWTRNVIITLVAHGILAVHVGTFNSLWFVFLSTPRFDPSKPNPPWLETQSFPFHFTGGLAQPPPKIGLCLALIGIIGITLQLFLYPRISAQLGTAKSYRLSLPFFPIVYLLVPLLVLVPSTSSPPAAASGPLVYFAISIVLFIQVFARTFALPATAILLNNCCPHPSVLGTIHGLGQTVSSATRTVGPIFGGWAFGKGLRIGMVGLAWWSFAAVACVGVCVGLFVREGSGHEVLMEGEEELDGLGNERKAGRER